jgi:hypothetical protein
MPEYHWMGLLQTDNLSAQGGGAGGVVGLSVGLGNGQGVEVGLW